MIFIVPFENGMRLGGTPLQALDNAQRPLL
jgi:hypothetical protein